MTSNCTDFKCNVQAARGSCERSQLYTGKACANRQFRLSSHLPNRLFWSQLFYPLMPCVFANHVIARTKKCISFTERNERQLCIGNYRKQYTYVTSQSCRFLCRSHNALHEYDVKSIVKFASIIYTLEFIILSCKRAVPVTVKKLIFREVCDWSSAVLNKSVQTDN